MDASMTTWFEENQGGGGEGRRKLPAGAKQASKGEKEIVLDATEAAGAANDGFPIGGGGAEAVVDEAIKARLQREPCAVARIQTGGCRGCRTLSIHALIATERQQLVAELRAETEYQGGAIEELREKAAAHEEGMRAAAELLEVKKRAASELEAEKERAEAALEEEWKLVAELRAKTERQGSAMWELLATNKELVAQVVEDTKQARAAKAKNNQLEEALWSSEQSLVEAATIIQALEQAASRSLLPEARLSSSLSPPSARVDSTRVAAASVGGGVGTNNDNNSSDPDRLLEVERQKSRALAQAADVIKGGWRCGQVGLEVGQSSSSSPSSSPPSARVDSTRVATAGVDGGVSPSNDNNSDQPWGGDTSSPSPSSSPAGEAARVSVFGTADASAPGAATSAPVGASDLDSLLAVEWQKIKALAQAADAIKRGWRCWLEAGQLSSSPSSSPPSARVDSTRGATAGGGGGVSASNDSNSERQEFGAIAQAANAIEGGWRCRRARLEAGLRRARREKVVVLQCWVRATAAVVVYMQRRRQEATRGKTTVVVNVGVEPSPEGEEESTAGTNGDGGRPQRCANSEWTKKEVRRREEARDAVLLEQEARRRGLRGGYAPLPKERYDVEEKTIAAKAEAERTAETTHYPAEAQTVPMAELEVSQRQQQAEQRLEAKLGGVEARATKVTARRAMNQKEAESQSKVALQQDETEDRLKAEQQRHENGGGVLLQSEKQLGAQQQASERQLVVQQAKQAERAGQKELPQERAATTEGDTAVLDGIHHKRGPHYRSSGPQRWGQTKHCYCSSAQREREVRYHGSPKRWERKTAKEGGAEDPLCQWTSGSGGAATCKVEQWDTEEASSTWPGRPPGPWPWARQ